MKANAIKKQSIIPRLDGIAKDIHKLHELGGKKDFLNNEDNFHLAQFHLRQALEGVFHIGAHILSRLNGGRSTEYKDIARRLGELKIIDLTYAQTSLVKMAGYRNRLTHFYASITPQEMLKVIKEDLQDFQPFLKAIKDVLSSPQHHGLTVE